MILRCLCGKTLDNSGAPNDIEHLLLSYSAMESLQDLADAECQTSGEIQMWPEHWDQAGAIHVWKCVDCGRLYVNAKGRREDVTVYKIERKGLPPLTT